MWITLNRDTLKETFVEGQEIMLWHEMSGIWIMAWYTPECPGRAHLEPGYGFCSTGGPVPDVSVMDDPDFKFWAPYTHPRCEEKLHRLLEDLVPYVDDVSMTRRIQGQLTGRHY